MVPQQPNQPGKEGANIHEIRPKHTIIGKLVAPPEYAVNVEGVAELEFVVQEQHTDDPEAQEPGGVKPIRHHLVASGALARNAHDSLHEGDEVIAIYATIRETYTPHESTRHQRVVQRLIALGPNLGSAPATVRPYVYTQGED